MIVRASVQERPSRAIDAPPVKRDEISVQVATFDEAKAVVRAQLPAGWIVTSWRVEAE